MIKPSDEGFDQNDRKPTTASAPLPETTQEKLESSTNINIVTTNPITPAEYIYKTMIPPATSAIETAEVFSLGRRDRCNTGGSSKSGGPMMSMDLGFLSHDDVALDGGLAGLTSGDVSMRIQSSDFVKDLLTDAPVGESRSHLPDSAVTAAAALMAEEDDDCEPLPALPPTSGDANPTSTSCSSKPHQDQACPMMLNLTAKLERISTGDSIVPLRENFRISSSDWVEEFKSDAAGMGSMHPSLFRDSSAAARSPPPVSHNNVPQDRQSFEEYQVPIESSIHSHHQYSSAMPPLSNPGHSQPQQHPPMPPLSNNPRVVHNLPATSPVASVTKTSTSPSSSTTSKKRKKKRTIDATRAIEPTDDDVLFGRGGYTNTHRGNINFRKKALELRPWYESVSKEEKYNISQILIESVKGEGHRFLEKGKEDGLWHEVIGNGARKKASQALRERIKGKRRKAASGRGDHSSSIKSVGSAGSAVARGGGGIDAEDIEELLTPADMVGI